MRSPFLSARFNFLPGFVDYSSVGQHSFLPRVGPTVSHLPYCDSFRFFLYLGSTKKAVFSSGSFASCSPISAKNVESLSQNLCEVVRTAYGRRTVSGWQSPSGIRQSAAESLRCYDWLVELLLCLSAFLRLQHWCFTLSFERSTVLR